MTEKQHTNVNSVTKHSYYCHSGTATTRKFISKSNHSNVIFVITLLLQKRYIFPATRKRCMKMWSLKNRHLASAVENILQKLHLWYSIWQHIQAKKPIIVKFVTNFFVLREIFKCTWELTQEKNHLNANFAWRNFLKQLVYLDMLGETIHVRHHFHATFVEKHSQWKYIRKGTQPKIMHLYKHLVSNARYYQINAILWQKVQNGEIQSLLSRVQNPIFWK